MNIWIRLSFKRILPLTMVTTHIVWRSSTHEWVFDDLRLLRPCSLISIIQSDACLHDLDSELIRDEHGQELARRIYVPIPDDIPSWGIHPVVAYLSLAMDHTNQTSEDSIPRPLPVPFTLYDWEEQWIRTIAWSHLPYVLQCCERFGIHHASVLCRVAIARPLRNQ